MKLDFQTLLNELVKAAENSFKEKWPAIRDLATSSFKTLAQNLVDIEELKTNGIISEEQARFKFDIQQNAFKIVLLSEEGLGLLAVEAALNAALDAIKQAVNTAIRFSLL